MSESYTAALIGGPEAGKVYGVRNREPIRMMLPRTGLHLWPYDEDLVKPIETEEMVYEPRAMEFFGAPFFVWCAPEFMGDSNRNMFAAQLGAHILSPLGLALLREGQQ